MPRLARRFVLQGVIASGLSILVGIAATAEASSALGQFGGFEYAPRVVVVSAVREYGSSASTLGTLFGHRDVAGADRG
jgi:hypothetical protein